MQIKIHRGTPPQATEGLCESCRHSRIVRGRRLGDELVFCDGMLMRPVRISFTVTSCSQYLDGRAPSYHELLEQAWILRPASKRRVAGFVRVGDLSGREAARLYADPTEEED